MSNLSQTRKAIREEDANYTAFDVWISEEGEPPKNIAVSIADLKELEAAYTELENALERINESFGVRHRHPAEHMLEVCTIAETALGSREDPPSAEARAASPAKGLSESGS